MPRTNLLIGLLPRLPFQSLPHQGNSNSVCPVSQTLESSSNSLALPPHNCSPPAGLVSSPFKNRCRIGPLPPTTLVHLTHTSIVVEAFLPLLSLLLHHLSFSSSGSPKDPAKTKSGDFPAAPFLSPEALPNPGTEPASPALETVSCITGRFFTDWATREALNIFFYSFILLFSFELCKDRSFILVCKLC